MMKLPKTGVRGRPWSAARCFRGWLATWAQDRRRGRQNHLLPAPVLAPQNPSLAVWTWTAANPARWNAYNSLDGGLTYQFDDWVAGNARQYAPDGGQHPMFIVGVDANGVEITERSNVVRPDDAIILSVPGLKLWVRVESLNALANNAAVGSWSDESGNGKHLTQAVAGSRPHYKSSGDGSPAVLFDGGNNVLSTSSNVFATNTHTIFLVARPLSTASNDAVGTGNVTDGDVLLMIGYSDRMRGHTWRVGNANPPTDGATQIHGGAFAIFEQEVTATNLLLRLTGALDASLTLVGGLVGASKPVYLGSRNNSWFFNGYVRALLVYEGNPTDPQKTAIRNYLISSYGIPVPYPAVPVPGAPSSFDVVDTGGGSAWLTWDMSTSAYASGVKIERKLAAEPDANYIQIDDIGGSEIEYYDGVGSGDFTYRIRAYNTSGNSPYTTPVTVTIT